MTPELEAKLKACPNLPSPPAVAITNHPTRERAGDQLRPHHSDPEQ